MTHQENIKLPNNNISLKALKILRKILYESLNMCDFTSYSKEYRLDVKNINAKRNNRDGKRRQTKKMKN